MSEDFLLGDFVEDSMPEREGLEVDGSTKASKLVVESMAPSTRRNYDHYVRLYEEYRADRGSPPHGVSIFEDFMVGLAGRYRGSTMQVIGSVVKKYLLLEKKLDLGKTAVVEAVVKGKRKKERVDHAAVFQQEEIMRYLFGLSDEESWLSKKLMILCGCLGGLRASELVHLFFADVEVIGCGLVLNIRFSKGDQSGEGSKVIVPRLEWARVDPVTIFEAYRKSVPSVEGRLFLQYRCGRYVMQPIGVHQVTNIVHDMAKEIKPESWKEFSSHSLRRTNATSIVDASGSDAELTRHLRWKSRRVAQSYVEHSLVGEMKVASMLSHAIAQSLSDGKVLEAGSPEKQTGCQVVLNACVLNDCKL